MEGLLAGDLEDLYTDPAADPSFDEVLTHVDVDSDADLAGLIEADGRLRLRLRQDVTLDRYLGAVPDLAARPDPLDAAVDMALRALARTSRADERSVQELIDQYPQFGAFIREAAALNNALWSTARIRKHVQPRKVKDLPCPFGPEQEDGTQRYELRELLGEGAFGQVYLAVDRRLSEVDHPAFVSIKVLTGEDRSAATRQHLIDEATKARRINHPNVARVLDLGVSADNEDYVVYEFVGGGDLARWSRRSGRSVPVRDAVQMVARVARGVHAAHMAGLVHCDLKPNNIVLSVDGEPKVADFGVAIRADDRRPLKSDPDDPAPLGNLAFMSPEQFRMEDGALTIPTDVYALGGILYWLLTGILPNGSTPEAIRRTHDRTRGRVEPPALRANRREVDRDLETICQRALAARPEDRFSSAAALAESLELWSRREPVAWTRPSLLHRFTLWARRKPGVAASAGLILMLLVVGGVMLQHLAGVARRETFEAAIAAIRLEQEEAYRQKFRSNLRAFILRLREATSQGLEHEVFPQIWLAEWLFGPTVYGEGEERFELWKLRVEAVGRLVEESKARGGERALNTLLWESALVFWHIHDGRYADAEPLIIDNYAKWADTVAPDDPWLLQLRAMRACVTVGLGAESRRADLEQAVATLQEAETVLGEDERGSGLHVLVLEHLARAYGPSMLNRPTSLDAIQATLMEVMK